MSYVIGFVCVFAMAVVFTFLTIYRQTKFSAVWATLGFVFWFALGLINAAVFSLQPALIPLGYLWFSCGAVLEIIGITISLTMFKSDKEGRDLEI